MALARVLHPRNMPPVEAVLNGQTLKLVKEGKIRFMLNGE